MRVLCVGRHAFLSEHLCRVFGGVGALCEPAVGVAEVPRRAARFDPDVLVCEGDLLSAALLESWSHEPALRTLPVLAVSLTPQLDDVLAADVGTTDPAAVVHLPGLDDTQLASLLATVRRASGVAAPPDWRVAPKSPPIHQR